MKSIDPRAFEYALSKITDGNVFEKFAQDLLCQILGQDFVPIGGLKDKGIDGLEHCLEPGGVAKTIYQISIDSDSKGKIERTLSTLSRNSIVCSRFFYVSNRMIKDQHLLEEDLYEKFEVTVKCRDAAWLRGNVNKTEGTVRSYLTFIEHYFHEYTKPGKSFLLADFYKDPRIFVFLRQQWEGYRDKIRLDDLLVDSLIIYALEGTDPDKNSFLARDEIVTQINSIVNFSPSLIEVRIDRRLEILSRKPRRINHHRRIDKYCLPYETRLEIDEKNLQDVSIYENFFGSMVNRIQEKLLGHDVRVMDVKALLESLINNIFKEQGLEFSDFVIKSENTEAVERSLPDIISSTVDNSSIIPPNRGVVKATLLGVIRDIIYQGSEEEKEYLRRLANSYMLLFLLQCDPKVAAYFSTLANKTTIFVCTSLLVPALSEYPLEKRHRRHWNLLVNSSQAGIKLVVNGVIIKELAGHIRKSLQVYREEYEKHKDMYTDENAIPYIKEILIRSYFYSRLRGGEGSFSNFIDNFVTPGAHDIEEQLIEFLKYHFNIEYRDERTMDVSIDENDLEKLTNELSKFKPSKIQASTDAKTVLSVCALREKYNEKGGSGIFGYQTWWLSKDTLTQRAVTTCFGNKYATSCYIRPDFLYNYISLAPSRSQTAEVFDSFFPTLPGISVSHHVPEEISNVVHTTIKEHSEKDPARVRAIIRSLADKLKTDPNAIHAHKLEHYLDNPERLAEILQ